MFNLIAESCLQFRTIYAKFALQGVDRPQRRAQLRVFQEMKSGLFYSSHVIRRMYKKVRIKQDSNTACYGDIT